MAETPHLDACPFCAGKAEARVGLHAFEDVVIACTKCEAEGPLFDSEEGLARNMADAAAHWNTRAQRWIQLRGTSP